MPMDLGAPDNYPPAYMAVLVMEDLPADEKIIYEGSVYSTENPEPDLSDCVFINDYSDYEPFLNWDWEKEPLYWRCLYLLHPDAEGNYPVKDWMVREQLDYANYVYSNYFNLPGQTETGVRFVGATTAPDGTPLETPGIVHEKEAVEIDYEKTTGIYGTMSMRSMCGSARSIMCTRTSTAYSPGSRFSPTSMKTR